MVYCFQLVNSSRSLICHLSVLIFLFFAQPFLIVSPHLSLSLLRNRLVKLIAQLRLFRVREIEARKRREATIILTRRHRGVDTKRENVRVRDFEKIPARTGLRPTAATTLASSREHQSNLGAVIWTSRPFRYHWLSASLKWQSSAELLQLARLQKRRKRRNWHSFDEYQFQSYASKKSRVKLFLVDCRTENEIGLERFWKKLSKIFHWFRKIVHLNFWSYNKIIHSLLFISLGTLNLLWHFK